jgi:uncharacterized membrane protein (DUF373 family)
MTYVNFLFLLICHITFFVNLIGCLNAMIKYDCTVNFKELNQLKKFYSVTKNGLKQLQNNTFGVD